MTSGLYISTGSSPTHKDKQIRTHLRPPDADAHFISATPLFLLFEFGSN